MPYHTEPTAYTVMFIRSMPTVTSKVSLGTVVTVGAYVLYGNDALSLRSRMVAHTACTIARTACTVARTACTVGRTVSTFSCYDIFC